MAIINKFEYIEIEDNPEFKSLRIKNIKGFIKLLQQYQVKLVLRTEKTEADGKATGEFLFLENQVLYRIFGNNFKSIEEFEDASRGDFPDADSFYEAQKAGVTTYREYHDCIKTGVVDKQVYAKAQKLGFLDAFDKFRDRCEQNRALIPQNFNLEDIDTPIKLCEFAITKGFKDYGDFDKGFFLGFSDKITYDDAKQKGFTYGDDYLNAVKMGFDQVKEYQEAKHLKIQNKFEYTRYLTLKNSAKGIYSFDQMVLLTALKNTDNGKKLSLKKLMELLKQKEEELKFVTTEDETREFPEWYIKKLNTEADIHTFFAQQSKIKEYGIFDTDGEYFEVWRISHQKIYVDGNNVAFANNRKRENADGDDKPHCSNIKLVVDELYRQRFEEIVVIGDPGLKKRTPDLNVLTKMISDKRITYHEAPSTTEADEFFIKRAKADKCYIISNDTFRDWKFKDDWISDNIDRIRIPFMINNGIVTLSGIEKLIAETSE